MLDDRTGGIPMVSNETITRKFSALDGYLAVLLKLSRTPTEEFLRDKILIGSMRYYLQVSVESCLDVANHVIASEKFRAPKDYADSFTVLQEENVLSPDLSNRLRQMAKFRNRLVHLYGEIDDRRVHAALVEDLDDIRQFKTMIVKRFLN